MDKLPHQPQINISPEQAPPESLSRRVDELYGRAMAAEPGAELNGWQVYLQDEVATFVQPRSRPDGMVTGYDKWMLTRSDDGRRVVTREPQRPSYENEGFGMTVRMSTSFPLDDELPVMRSKLVGRLMHDGTLQAAHPEVEIADPLSDSGRVHLLCELNRIVEPAPVERAGRLARIMARLRGAR